MLIGIIGPEQSGKTTIFNALTGRDVSSFDTQMHQAVVDVKDHRIEKLSEIFEPHRTIFPKIEFIDSGAYQGMSEKQFIAELRKTDGIIKVIKGFDCNIDDEIGLLNTGLILADLEIAKNRLERLSKGIKKLTKEEEKEKKLLEKIISDLENEKIPDISDFNEDDIKLIKGFGFLTLKPSIIVINIKDGDKEKDYKSPYGEEVINIYGETEKEISLLDEEDRKEFLEDAGIKEPAINRMIRSIYSSLGLISFFTVGKDEVRGWPIKKGTIAVDAAGEIHSDIKRGFIKAQVIDYDTFMQYKSMKEARNAGVLRLEGKEYIVKDGDIIEFRFNV